MDQTFLNAWIPSRSKKSERETHTLKQDSVALWQMYAISFCTFTESKGIWL